MFAFQKSALCQLILLYRFHSLTQFDFPQLQNRLSNCGIVPIISITIKPKYIATTDIHITHYLNCYMSCHLNNELGPRKQVGLLNDISTLKNNFGETFQAARIFVVLRVCAIHVCYCIALSKFELTILYARDSCCFFQASTSRSNVAKWMIHNYQESQQYQENGGTRVRSVFIKVGAEKQ